MQLTPRPSAVTARVGTAVLLFGLACLAAAQEKKPAAQERYPKVNLATWYAVDPDWPQKPTEFKWGDMPGVAVDKDDRVWIFTRSTPPVQVYDADGRFVRAWGDDTVKRAHHIKFDVEGNVWLADIGHHVVRKYSTDGKVLLTLGTVDEPDRKSVV